MFATFFQATALMAAALFAGRVIADAIVNPRITLIEQVGEAAEGCWDRFIQWTIS